MGVGVGESGADANQSGAVGGHGVALGAGIGRLAGREILEGQGNCSRLRGSDRLSTGIAYLATALGTAKKPADLINSEQLQVRMEISRSFWLM